MNHSSFSFAPTHRVGAYPLGSGGYRFRVWAPLLPQVELKLLSPIEQRLSMQQDAEGYWQAELEGIPEGPLDYLFVLHQEQGQVERPDPASRWQPHGVHGPSRVLHPDFAWQDSAWPGIPLEQWILYELHVGTFTPEGTFAAIIPRLPELLDLGVNVLELMPVAQCPGGRNWGYDGVYPYAVQTAYGGATELKQLVNACHQVGMAVILDVVYNHLGPEGNYLREFGPYFTDKYHTPWGSALNFDDRYCDGVREFFLQNAEFWLEEFHLDGLRLDAIHAIYDFSARPFLGELSQRVEALSQRIGWKRHLIAETDLNDVKIITPREQGGYGIDAQWCDDFHHCVHTLLTGEREGYYEDFGRLEQLAKSYRESYVFSGQYSPHRARRYGNSAAQRPGSQFVICIQNHDQVGNRMWGDRLSQLTSFEGLKLAAAALLLAPMLPMLFMGEEYGETAPFQYFVSHGDPDLVEAVRQGRRREFSAFSWKGEVPDPQSEETFNRSKLNWNLNSAGQHQALWRWYQTLIRLRKTLPALQSFERSTVQADLFAESGLALQRQQGSDLLIALFNFHPEHSMAYSGWPAGSWQKLLDSQDPDWLGSGSTMLPQTTGDPVEVPAYGVGVYRQKGS
ncbi:malto-oligosyltrehalose trehalohydrolase [Thermostichus vulcanus]|uniref:Malto-oligosyltrehalose trehalohydrolase n=1 Tax=Thermostichus vulcanus str. 'Rupite' TaxID=2813851 RepID=A0ABT0CE28_THEVL|nr:malto-oligosyltrehalose trehalohydrolase [Thermostichus vulcanus]MCJ2544035.1 malto-oligosyltrehalose trehalohydrolase [Thermostichus vulcanus str. 'Rupite']